MCSSHKLNLTAQDAACGARCDPSRRPCEGRSVSAAFYDNRLASRQVPNQPTSSRFAFDRLSAQQITGAHSCRAAYRCCDFGSGEPKLLCTGGMSNELAIDGDALSHRPVAPFDSNTSRDDSHSLLNLSVRSLASAGRHDCSRPSTRSASLVLKCSRVRR